MKELGDYSIDFHRQVGAGAVAQGIDQLVILADPAEAAAMAEGAATIDTQLFENHDAVIKYLKQIMQPGDRVLFKASRAVGLDRVVEALR
jgi:UDP-N-acetylmuramoyl-tripeptide--D-alanyl-D-alanine ligase